MKYLVAGNYAKFSVTLTQKSGELIVPYIPTEGDVVQISLYGARRFDYPNYTQAQNVLTFEDNGCLNVGLYCLEVKITEANTHKLRCMYREQIRVVASNDDVPTDASFTDDDVQLSGQFDIVASTEIVVDDELSDTSENPVQNKVVTAAIYDRIEKGLYWDFTRLTYSDAGEELDIDGSVYVGEDEIATMTAYLPVAGTLDEYNNPLPGVMSVSDKTKLDSIEEGANKTLFDNEPTADSTKAVTSGGMFDYYRGAFFDFNYTPSAEAWEVSFMDKENNERLSITFDCANTVDGIAGLMSLADKIKLDALPSNTELQTSLAGKADGISTQPNAGSVSIELKSGNTTLATAFILDAGASNNGLMSASDYSKLAALPTADDLATALAGKQDTLTFDSTPTQDSNNPVTSGGLYNVLGDIESLLDNILGN